MESISTTGYGGTVLLARQDAAQKLRQGVQMTENVYLDNGEPRTKAWRPVHDHVEQHLVMMTGEVLSWEANIDWEWELGSTDS